MDEIERSVEDILPEDGEFVWNFIFLLQRLKSEKASMKLQVIFIPPSSDPDITTEKLEGQSRQTLTVSKSAIKILEKRH